MSQLAGEVFGIAQQLAAGHNGRADTNVNKHQHKIPALSHFQLMKCQ